MLQKIINEYRLTYDEAIDLLNTTPKDELYKLANGLREHFQKRRISTCMIMNAKSGACSEDCKWCSQSGFHKTNVPVYKLVSIDDALQDAHIAEKAGSKMFGLVTSGRKVSPSELNLLSDIYNTLRKETPKLNLCSSLGLLSKPELQKLFDSGVKRYHCNIETSPSFFPQLCSTHTIDEKISTIKAAKEIGMEICSGGIIGMGESMEQRIEMAILLRQLNVDSIPLNLLQPIKGTPLQNANPLTDEEILTSFAIFRIVHPSADIRFAGGRARIKHIQEDALKCGVSASLIGDMLTTVGSKVHEDLALFERLGYEY